MTAPAPVLGKFSLTLLAQILSRAACMQEAFNDHAERSCMPRLRVKRDSYQIEGRTMKVSFEIAKETYKIGIFKTIPVHVLYWTTEFNESELSAIERMNIGEELVVGMPTIAYPQTIEENRQRYPKLNGFAPFLLEDLVKCKRRRQTPLALRDGTRRAARCRRFQTLPRQSEKRP